MGGNQALDIETLRDNGRYDLAVFAGGCFWCMQGPFDAQEGVQRCLPGYCGGDTENPDYHSVCSGSTGHVEIVLVLYDPKVVSYEQLLEIFWRNIDPTQVNGQFADRGSQYKTAIFCFDELQTIAAERSKEQLQASDLFSLPIVTEILPFAPLYLAEDYHIDYYKKHPVRYKMYHMQSGRAGFLKSAWRSTKD